MRNFARIAAVSLLLLLASGCDLRLGVEVELDADGGGTLAVVVVADADLVQQAAAADADPLGRLAQRVEQADTGWDVELADTPDGGRSVTLRTGFADPAEFAARYEEVRAALDTPEATILGPLQVTLDEEQRVLGVDGELSVLVGEQVAADRGQTVEEVHAALAGAVGASVVVTSPGPLLEVRPPGTAVFPDAGPEAGPVTVTWSAGPGEQVPVTARFEQPSSNLVGLLVQGGIVVLALLAIAGGVAAQRRR